MSRPRKDTTVEREPKHDPKPSLKMRVSPNWENMESTESDTPDRQRIPPHMVPPGMAFLWVTDTVLGQDFGYHRSTFEKAGWTPVHQEDFDRILDGLFMKRGAEGEIRMAGQVLMARPSELNERAKRKERRAAMEQVHIKEQALRGGDMPISLDSKDPSAIGFNRINKSVERIDIPKD